VILERVLFVERPVHVPKMSTNNNDDNDRRELAPSFVDKPIYSGREIIDL
jgi:hypothetical protein